MSQDDAPGTSQDASPPRDCGGPHRLTDVDAYRLLVRLASTVQHLSARCWSTAAATALNAAAHTLRTLASALYRANMRE